MSTVLSVKKTCGNCGEEVAFLALTSTNTFGYPDLDLRPAEMKRSTMCHWLHECPKCGYVSADISKKPDFDADYLESVEYKSCGGRGFSSPLARKFYRRYLLALKAEDTNCAYISLIRTAWCCDDCGDAANSVLCRRKAAELFVRLKQDENYIARHIDILRRAELFEKAISMCDENPLVGSPIGKIIKFQKEKCLARDAGVYTLADVK